MSYVFVICSRAVVLQRILRSFFYPAGLFMFSSFYGFYGFSV
tara:strand:- start:768 stop:893 length:126 start_codon:yes stop_codon:yes gene_type:complete